MNGQASRAGWGSVLLAAACVGFFAAQAAAADPLASFSVEAGKHDRLDTPVCVDLAGVGDLPKSFHLAEIKDGKPIPVPCQLEQGKPPRLWWVLFGKTPAGSARTYALIGGAADVSTKGVTVQKDEAKLDVLCGGVKVLRYHLTPPAPPEGVKPVFTRAAYIHPLWSAPGAAGPAEQRVLTQDFPRDHYHHHGIWSPWTSTTFEGRHVDFWNLGAQEGTVRLIKLLGTSEGPVYGGFRAAHDYVVLKAVLEKDPQGKPTKTGEKVALHETWDLRVFNAAPGAWLWQITSTQWCAGDSPLTVNKYHYGGMSIRAAKEWQGSAPDTYRTSEGQTADGVDKSLARWFIVSGTIDGHRDSLLMMSHPQNVNHPEGMRCWGKMKNVFIGWCPGKRQAFTMAPGKKYVFQYGFHVSEGKLPAESAQRLWADFGEPPSVKTNGPSGISK